MLATREVPRAIEAVADQACRGLFAFAALLAAEEFAHPLFSPLIQAHGAIPVKKLT
jgi:hypothetical protein